MAFSEYRTQLSIDRFFQIIGLQPFHGNQFHFPASLTTDFAGGCSAVIYQHRWQSESGVPGRNDIGRAIFEAEKNLEGWLGFTLMKGWQVERLPRLGHIEMDHGYFIEPAVRVAELVEAEVSIDTEDVDGDGFNETATVEVSNVDADILAAYEDVEEFRLYYPGKGADQRWEIRPVDVVVDGTTLTFTFSLSQVVDPNIVEQMLPGALDPEDSANFLSEVDVYWVHSDATIASALTATCVDSAGVVTHPSTEHGRVLVASYEKSIVHVHSGVGCSCSGGPRFTLGYSAGWPESTFARMDPSFERAIVALVMADLGGICSCKNVLGIASEYSRNLTMTRHAESSGPGTINSEAWSSQFAASMKDNPLGITEGARLAWSIIDTERLGKTMNEYTPTNNPGLEQYEPRGGRWSRG